MRAWFSRLVILQTDVCDIARVKLSFMRLFQGYVPISTPPTFQSSTYEYFFSAMASAFAASSFSFRLGSNELPST